MDTTSTVYKNQGNLCKILKLKTLNYPVLEEGKMQTLLYPPWVEENARVKLSSLGGRKCIQLTYRPEGAKMQLIIQQSPYWHILCIMAALALHQNTKEKHNMQKQTNIIKPKYHLYLLAAPESGRSSSRMSRRAEPPSAIDPQGSITHM